MSSFHWFDSSGAGALIIDAELARHWTGFYRRADDLDDSPDLESENGELWVIDDTFDFANPKTAYDRLCWQHQQRFAEVLLNGLEGRAFVSIQDSNDEFSWWPESRTCTGSGASNPPAADWMARVQVKRLGSIELESGKAWLMNPCLHGLELDDSVDGAIAIDLPPGRYDVDYCPAHGNDENLLLVRLTRG